MDDDWDLNAVVRGFTATGSTTVNASNNNYFPSFSSSFPNNYNNENHSFDFPNLVDNRSVDSFQGLHEVYQALCVDPPPATHAASAMTQVYQPQYDQTLTMHPPPPQMNVQMQENVPFNNMMMVAPPMVSFSVTNSQSIRPRRRKSQQAKMVHQVTEEELAADAWAWRKYGQKRIKGSPYPRNYYRCSTAKGCAARKHVERSPDDPNIFLVTHSGEHTHPRPNNRTASIARSQAKNNNNNNSNSAPNSSSTLSPGTPMMDDETIIAQKGNVVVETGDNITTTNNNNVIVPDDHLMYDENMYNGFHRQDLLVASPLWNSTTF